MNKRTLSFLQAITAVYRLTDTTPEFRARLIAELIREADYYFLFGRVLETGTQFLHPRDAPAVFLAMDDHMVNLVATALRQQVETDVLLDDVTP